MPRLGLTPNRGSSQSDEVGIYSTSSMGNQPTTRVPPTDAPSEAVERVAGARRLLPTSGDLVILRESAGLAAASGIWRYSLTVNGRDEAMRVFASYDAAAVEGEQMAAIRKVRLIYFEEGVPVLLIDHRLH